jgi:hypothetical protein
LLAQIWLHLVVFESFMEVLMHDLYIRKFLEWRCYLGRFLHLKPTAGCQISTLIFLDFFWGADPINISWKIANGRQSSFSLGVYIKGIVQAFNWLMCLGGFLHLKPTAGCQISTLIFGFFFGGRPMKNCQRTAKFFLTWGLNQRYCPGLKWLDVSLAAKCHVLGHSVL